MTATIADSRVDEFFDFLESTEGSQTLDLFVAGRTPPNVLLYLSEKYGLSMYLLSRIDTRLFFQRGNHLHN